MPGAISLHSDPPPGKPGAGHQAKRQASSYSKQQAAGLRQIVARQFGELT
jgi:hypothetical protein